MQTCQMEPPTGARLDIIGMRLRQLTWPLSHGRRTPMCVWERQREKETRRERERRGTNPRGAHERGGGERERHVGKFLSTCSQNGLQKPFRVRERERERARKRLRASEIDREKERQKCKETERQRDTRTRAHAQQYSCIFCMYLKYRTHILHPITYKCTYGNNE